MTTATAPSHLYELTAETLIGAEQPMSDYQGQVLLMVNTASKCGFTPHYTGLQELHDSYGEQGLKVMGFPCNQFGGQEPGGPAEIKACTGQYGVTFPIVRAVEKQ